MSSKCSICKESITRERINCYGVCDRTFHTRCIGVNTNAVKALNENSNLKYVCNECEDKSCKTVLHKVNMLIENMKSESENNKMMSEAIHNIEEMKEVIKRSEIEISKLVKNYDNKQKGETYADKLKQVNGPVVLVVPKNSQTVAETKKEVKNKIDPTKVPIHSLRNASKGTIVLEGKPSANIEEIKNYARQQMGNKYDVKITELKSPKLKIVGLSEKLSEEVIINNMKMQNPIIKEASIKVIKIYGNKQFTALIEIDSSSFHKLMIEKRINIGWDRCIVYEYFAINMCFKCNGYNHKAANCTNKKSCKKCAGEHDIRECDVTEKKCVNCCIMNTNLNLKLNTEHEANSLQCRVHERQIENERKRVNYVAEN